MDNRITWIGMDVHKESIVVTAVPHDSDRATARFDKSQAVLTEYLVALEQELERIHRLNVKIEEESHRPEIAPAVARLRTLRSVYTVTAMTLVSELVDFSRFTAAH